MITPTITLTGVEEALADIDRRLSIMSDGVTTALDWFGKNATEEMIDTHTFQNRTFRLEGSIDYDVVPASAGDRTAVVAVFAMASYASQVEFGHPGPPPARPYPFFWPVFYKWEPALYERLQTVVEFAIYDGKAA